MKTLDELRQEIDRLDASLRDILRTRLDVSRQVAESKIGTGLSVYRPDRETTILENFKNNIPEEVLRPYASASYRSILRASREYQYYHQMQSGVECPIVNLLADAQPELPCVDTVCFQGIDGSWSSLAAKKMYPDATRIPVASFAGVFSMLTDGKAQAGMLPLDNSTAGTVNDVYDLLIKHDYYIVKASPIHIHNCLLALPGADIKNIRTVYSHPQALSQCAEHIKELSAIPVPETNTAVAAQAVAQAGVLTAAAIGSPDAAKQYGLIILKDNFNDAPCNQTRFLSVSRTLCAPKDANRLSLAFAAPNESGALANVLAIFADNGLNLTKIMSRPTPDRPWEYIFYLDCEIQVDSSVLFAVLYQLSAELPWLRLLGCYHEDTLPDLKG